MDVVNDSTILPGRTRALFIDFDLHTDGDNEFKKELTSLMIDNVLELLQALRLADQQNDLKVFSKVLHKVKSTIGMLNDPDLTEVIARLCDPALRTDEKKRNAVLFDRLCNEIIKHLKKEVASD